MCNLPATHYIIHWNQRGAYGCAAHINLMRETPQDIILPREIVLPERTCQYQEPVIEPWSWSI